MNQGFEEAKSRRNWLERLTARIPGFRGFQDRELRRDVDRMQREHLSNELGRLKSDVRRKAQAYTDAGRIGALQRFERLDRKLDGLSQAVRFADYGQSGFFDVIKFGAEELDKLYAFDVSLLEDVEALAGALAAIPAPGGEPEGGAMDAALERLAALQEKWAGREDVIHEVVER